MQYALFKKVTVEVRAQQPGISVSIVVERIPHSEKQLPYRKERNYREDPLLLCRRFC